MHTSERQASVSCSHDSLLQDASSCVSSITTDFKVSARSLPMSSTLSARHTSNQPANVHVPRATVAMRHVARLLPQNQDPPDAEGAPGLRQHGIVNSCGHSSARSSLQRVALRPASYWQQKGDLQHAFQ